LEADEELTAHIYSVSRLRSILQLKRLGYRFVGIILHPT